MSRPSAPTGQTTAQLNSAIKLHQSGQHEKALQTIQRVLAKNPKLGDAHYIAAGVLIAKGDLDRAMYHAEQAAKADPNRAEFHAAIGSVHATAKRFTESIPHYQRALELNADLPDAINGLGVAFKETGYAAQAITLFDRLIRLQPNNQDAIINRALLDANAGRAHAAVTRLDEASKRFPQNPILHDVLALASTYDDELTPEQSFELHQRFGLVLQGHLRARNQHSNAPEPNRKIRVGYISAEFRQHSNNYFLAPILDHHDHNQFEVFLYSTNARRDAVTDRLESAADHWRLHRSNDLRGIIDTILEDRIDILVELTGHFASNNLPILATKPAPVQISYLGYANTTGLTTID
ncbi:MAG: tetratricopeptide repeat protein, partial [Phycisphaerales bacterium]|nr:tetratricopeptide repeat protein [Phycisphaerales bacterium]